ncbi:MAG TPA: hypothetical protein VGE52_14255, partial [Pirellulales bacterium]
MTTPEATDPLVGTVLIVALIEWGFPIWRRIQSARDRLTVVAALVIALPFVNFREIFINPGRFPWSVYQLPYMASVLLIWWEICRAIGLFRATLRSEPPPRDSLP